MNKLGFGFLRLPLLNAADEKSIDCDRLCSLVDAFLEKGGRWFDTAYTYHGGESEAALRCCLTQRHARERYSLCDKLPSWMVHSVSDCESIFSSQLERCGTEYFDRYLLHGLDSENYTECKKAGAFEFLSRLKARGLAGEIGFSFHDSPQLLEEILTEQPDMDCVLLQINYLDWRSSAICSGECYEIAARHGKKIMVMEPVKGGNLAALPPEAAAILAEKRPDWSAARWAISFARNLRLVETVLSGMNSLAQIEENLSDTEPLDDEDLALLERVADLMRKRSGADCTRCRYCTTHCPQNIDIPGQIELHNEYLLSPDEKWKLEYKYSGADCIGCGQCLRHCPQKLDIPEIMKKTAEIFAAQP